MEIRTYAFDGIYYTYTIAKAAWSNFCISKRCHSQRCAIISLIRILWRRISIPEQPVPKITNVTETSWIMRSAKHCANLLYGRRNVIVMMGEASAKKFVIWDSKYSFHAWLDQVYNCTPIVDWKERNMLLDNIFVFSYSRSKSYHVFSSLKVRRPNYFE